jgi:hypothetical protein
LLYSFERPPGSVFYRGVLLWSPDGQQIVYLSESPEGDTALIMPADGDSEPEELPEIPFFWSPEFWPQWCEPKSP